jgi:hypothetical protein
MPVFIFLSKQSMKSTTKSVGSASKLSVESESESLEAEEELGEEPLKEPSESSYPIHQIAALAFCNEQELTLQIFQDYLNHNGISLTDERV